MIAKSTSTEFWSAVFAGAEAAATEYNMDLTITGSESEGGLFLPERPD